MTPLRRRRTDPLAGSLDPVYPPPSNVEVDARSRPVDEDPRAEASSTGPEVVKAPSILRRIGSGLAEVRRRVLPLPDEVVDDFLATGEQVIHSDHPSFRSFVVENTLLFLGLLVAAAAFLGIAFNGSFTASAFLLVAVAVVLLILVLKRLEDRYTSYVVTDSRIMRLRGVVGRRAHSIPWVRVTDLTIEQPLWGRIFGYATLHIESANEDSGLRDLEGVSDPLQFTKHVVDMVVAKQGTTQPAWALEGAAPPPQTERGLRRVRLSRRRRDDEPTGRGARESARESAPSPASDREPAAAGRPRSTRTVRRSPGARPSEDAPYDVEAEVDADAEQLASELRSADEHDLPWRDSP